MTARRSDLEPAPFFVLRTPLLAWDEWLAFASELSAPAATDLESALAADRKRARERLRSIVAQPMVREALFVASPSLDESIDLWLADPDSERGAKAERTIVKYLARMAGRPTPFGLFAGCSVGTMGETTQLRLAPRSAYRRHTRLDMDYLFALCEALARDPELRARVRYHPNSSLYRAAGTLRYAEARLSAKVRAYHLVAVEPTDYLDALLERAREGGTAEALATFLADVAETSVEEAREFVTELLESQLLLPELSAPVTGPEPLLQLAQKLEGHPSAEVLRRAGAALSAIDGEPLGASPSRYRDVARSLGQLPVEVELARLFQVDLVKPAGELRLGREVLVEMVAGVELLHRLARPVDGLRGFREAFVARYESAEVPLAEVLDEESGIGFQRNESPGAEASPLLDGFVFPDRGGDAPRFGAREKLLLAKITAAFQRGQREIHLLPGDVDAMATRDSLPLPDSFAVVATVLAESESKLAAGDFRLRFRSASGPSGANLLGRFCHGDRALEGLVREHLEAEARLRPGAIFAEIVHLPEGRVGNILLRPVLRDWELTYLGTSGAPRDRQIPLEDLVVSVREGRIILRSKRHGREVIPRLSTAHWPSNPRSLGVYRFLCALQMQGVTPGLGWNWGALDATPVLPRLTCGRIILDVARWRIGADRLSAISEARGAAQFAAVQELRRALALPRFVALQEGDHLLPVDLDHVLPVETFTHLVKSRREIVLVELMQDLVAQGPEGRFVHELVVPFLRARPPTVESAPSPPSVPIVRRVPPGSDWLYAKLYAGAAGVDDLLRGVVAPLVRAAMQSGAATRWFFIRYADPHWHLRLRIEGAPARLREELEPALAAAAAPLFAQGKLWRLDFDTYHREVERYGGPEGMRLCERLFHADSEAVLAIVESLEGDAGDDARWRLALCGVDRLLGDLGLGLEARRKVVESMRNNLAREFGIETNFEKQLGQRFRRERSALEALLAPAVDEAHPLAPGLALLERRSITQRAVAGDLAAAERAGRLQMPVAGLAASLVHMHTNRILRSAARAQELIVYDFLLRLYDSQLARQKKGLG